MINLLPPEEKEKLALESTKQLIIVLGTTAIIPLICLILILLSIHIYLLGNINYEKILLQQSQTQYQTAEFLTFQKIIQQSNVSLSATSSFYANRLTTSDVLSLIASLSRPNNTYITNLSINNVSDKKSDISVVGFSDSRDHLLEFKKNLENTKGLSKITFSPESWVDAQNITFHLTLQATTPTP